MFTVEPISSVGRPYHRLSVLKTIRSYTFVIACVTELETRGDILTQRRPVVPRVKDMKSDSDEPILELARRKVATEGGSLRAALRELRAERRERARNIALEEAPKAELLEDGTYRRLSTDPRWPFGVEDDQIVAPFGLSKCGLPRSIPEEDNVAKRPGVNNAKKEARDLILDKLQRMGCDPIQIMAELAMTCPKPEVKLRAAAELATMVYPRLRGVESVQKNTETVFVIGVPTERHEDSSSWLKSAEGARRLAHAVSTAVDPVIEGTAEVVTK